MRWQRQGLVFVLFVVWLFATVPLHAAPITWQLVGVTLDDGATASGSFVFDADAFFFPDRYSDWNIIVTSGIFSAYNYQSGVDFGFTSGFSPSAVSFVAAPPNSATGRYLHLSFSSPLTDAGGTILLGTDHSLIDTSSFECNNCFTQRYITTGAVTSTPEPSNIGLVAATLAIASLLLKARPNATTPSCSRPKPE